MPDLLWTDAAHVAQQAVSGMDRGARRVTPGLPARAMNLSQFVPRGLLLPVVKRVYGRHV